MEGQVLWNKGGHPRAKMTIEMHPIYLAGPDVFLCMVNVIGTFMIIYAQGWAV